MELYKGLYYHLYNRTINCEPAFREARNYSYFLYKYNTYIAPHVKTYAYCLMPTHFHVLLQVNTENENQLKKNVGIMLSSYAKAFNHSFNRHGSLFQQHTKAILIDDDSYLITLIHYIHQNPLRAGLVEQFKDWPYSSYLAFCGIQPKTQLYTELIDQYYHDLGDFINASSEMIREVPRRFWI
ncbi:MAG: transposase [Calditrichaeota bacterium]|nr:MAG: transposase [Calditrichota bacterium]